MMAARKDKPQSVRELLEQWPRAKESKANAGTTSIRVRGPKQQPPRKP
jgi:hypothetical protein